MSQTSFPHFTVVHYVDAVALYFISGLYTNALSISSSTGVALQSSDMYTGCNGIN